MPAHPLPHLTRSSLATLAVVLPLFAAKPAVAEEQPPAPGEPPAAPAAPPAEAPAAPEGELPAEPPAGEPALAERVSNVEAQLESMSEPFSAMLSDVASM
jgi:hypothetical protein